MKSSVPSAVLYEQLVAAERRYPVGAFRTDLTVHDRRTLGTLSPGEQFLWILYDSGTLLIRPGSTVRLQDLEGMFSGIHWFFCDGAVLRELPDAETAISHFTEEAADACAAA